MAKQTLSLLVPLLFALSQACTPDILDTCDVAYCCHSIKAIQDSYKHTCSTTCCATKCVAPREVKRSPTIRTTDDGELQFVLGSNGRLAVIQPDGDVSYLENVQENTMTATVEALKLGMSLGRDVAAAQAGVELTKAIGDLRAESQTTFATKQAGDLLKVQVENSQTAILEKVGNTEQAINASLAKEVNNLKTFVQGINTSVNNDLVKAVKKAEDAAVAVVQTATSFGNDVSSRTINHKKDPTMSRIVTVYDKKPRLVLNPKISFYVNFEDGPVDLVSQKRAKMINEGGNLKLEQSRFGENGLYFYDRDYFVEWESLPVDALCLKSDFTVSFWFMSRQGYIGGGFHGSIFGAWSSTNADHLSSPDGWGLGLLSMGGLRFYGLGSNRRDVTHEKFQANRWYHMAL